MHRTAALALVLTGTLALGACGSGSSGGSGGSSDKSASGTSSGSSKKGGLMTIIVNDPSNP